MAAAEITPTGRECPFGDEELIVTKTDLKGHITYANDVFLRLSKYPISEVIGAPHCLIRHPEMPQCVFRYLWLTIAAGREIFAYVVNQARNGDHYWVFAHVTPTFDSAGRISGYHSNRRVPCREAVEKIRPVYALLLAEERKHANPEEGMRAALDLLVSHLNGLGMEYDEFVFSLEAQEQACTA